ncbi:hypothetical protein GQ607_001253 [Colletotrichum asianum]|uniref:Uncharacterized protein n=1 Tax=Colletotrichum asianum TaxID=702518 RepID=A0A8H3ZX20_9PEZI|nr:hypothetical protein GQ607_001253 [Colletotrichum asianum]
MAVIPPCLSPSPSSLLLLPPLNTSRWDVHLALHVLVVSSKVPPTRWPCLLMAFHPVTDRSSACLTDAKRSRQFVRGWMHIPNPALATCMVGETRQRPFPPLPHPPESLTDTAQSNIRKARNCIRQRLSRLPSLALVQRLSYRSSRGTHREIRCHRPKGGKQDVKKHRLWITQDLHRGLEVRTMREARRRSRLDDISPCVLPLMIGTLTQAGDHQARQDVALKGRSEMLQPERDEYLVHPINGSWHSCGPSVGHERWCPNG